MEQGGMETARLAVQLAPADPLTHWTLAGMERRSFLPGLMPDITRQYEVAASLSPNDYRFWLSLGTAREQAGDVAGAEKALRHAVELAPFYADPRWFLGNLLLRAGRLDEAFAELRRAAESHPANYRQQVFNLAGQVYGDDTEALKRAVGDTAAARTQLAAFLLERGREEEALRLWSSLSQAERAEQRAVGEAMLDKLIWKAHYRAALGLARDLAGENGAGLEAGQVRNGGFESEPGAAGAGVNAFEWQFTSVPQARISIDGRIFHAGSHSLRVVFNAASNLVFTNISQVLVVEPSTQYRLECYVRTEDLKTAGAPVIEVAEAADGQLLGSSASAPIGKSDWQLLTVDFKTTEKTEAVRVRTNRAPCAVADAAVCPIFGTIWYDDFNLQRLGASTQPNGDSDRGVNRRETRQSGAPP
jgi:hypothetical protein